MNKSFSEAKLETISKKLGDTEAPYPKSKIRNPVHVVYGGAHLFKADTPQKLGEIALKYLENYAPNFVELANAMWLRGADALPQYVDVMQDLEFKLADNPEKVKSENYNAWFASTVFNRVIEKLKTEPVEDFRIDFEDGYGFRTDAEEDSHCISASDELAELLRHGEIETGESGKNTSNISVSSSPSLPFSGFRIKSFAPETYKRAIRTLDLFLTNFLEKTGGNLPENFVVTLPKITRVEEVEILAELLEEFEKQNELQKNSIKIEIMIETPESVLILRELIRAGKDRVNSAHFGAYDFTSGLGISGFHQHLRHESCNFARQMMQISLTPIGIRLSDSVTTEMPIPVHRGENLSEKQLKENKLAVKNAWRKHFNNITFSLINGFYQSWDLHPAQLVARYAAVYAFFLESKDTQAARLKGFMEKATQAMTTGNQFDDAASAQGLLNFFNQALNCGAMRENEVLETTGLRSEELKRASFAKIMDNRQSPKS